MSQDSIENILARQILDSRGFPTVEVDVTLADGSFGRAAVPSGASVGKHEAVELRDGDQNRWHGKGVNRAIEAVNVEIFDVLCGIEAAEQRKIDRIMIELDGTDNKSYLGANAILAVSLAVSRAAAASMKMPYFRYLGGINACRLPVAMMNVINGGAHADNELDMQEFMICPHKADSFADSLRIGVEIFHSLKRNLIEAGHSVNVGDEGGFATAFTSAPQALDAITKAIETAGYRPAEQVTIAIDAAASQFFTDGLYRLKECDKPLNYAELVDYYGNLCDSYAISSIEDGMAEDDHTGWHKLTAVLGDRIKLIGDDLLVTNSQKLSYAIENKLANAILIKPNQIGTISETFDTISQAQKNRFGVVISHRSGETDDSSIADIAVAMNIERIKAGAPCRSERNAKYNQLLRIEQLLGDSKIF